MQKIEWLLKYFQSIIYGLNFYVLNPLKLIILNVKYWPLQITGLSFINNMSVLSILECRPKKRYRVLFRGFFVCFLVFGFFLVLLKETSMDKIHMSWEQGNIGGNQVNLKF